MGLKTAFKTKLPEFVVRGGGDSYTDGSPQAFSIEEFHGTVAELNRQAKVLVAAPLLRGDRRLLEYTSDGSRVYSCYYAGLRWLIRLGHGHVQYTIQNEGLQQLMTLQGPRLVNLRRIASVDRRKPYERWPRIAVALQLEDDLWDEKGILHAAYRDRRTRKLLYKLHLPVAWEMECCSCCGCFIRNVRIDNGLQDAALTKAVESLMSSLESDLG